MPRKNHLSKQGRPWRSFDQLKVGAIFSGIAAAALLWLIWRSPMLPARVAPVLKSVAAGPAIQPWAAVLERPGASEVGMTEDQSGATPSLIAERRQVYRYPNGTGVLVYKVSDPTSYYLVEITEGRDKARKGWVVMSDVRKL